MSMLNKRDHGVSETHLMVDIETMGVGHYAPVITIGAVVFDPWRQDSADYHMKRAFLRRIDVEDAIKHSNGVQGGTLRWWLGQEETAIKALLGEDAVALKTALRDFYAYCKDRGSWVDQAFFQGLAGEPPPSLMWAKSADFDGKLLEDAYERVGEPAPFRFFQYRCVRTIQDLAWPGGKDDRPTFDTGVKHDARADAVSQAMMVQAGYAQLGLSHKPVELDKGGQAA